MKRYLTAIILLLSVTNILPQNQVNILVILPSYYGANHFLNMDNFEKYGWNITIAGLSQTISPCPTYAQPLGCPIITADVLLSSINDITIYDGVVVMSASSWTSAPPCRDLINNQHTLDLLKDAANAGMLVAGTCTGVRLLAAAGVLNGKNATGNPKYSSEYTAAGATFVGAKHYPVIDGNIATTTAGDFFNIQNCNAMAKVIDGIKKINPGIPDNDEFSTFEQQLTNGVLRKTYGGIYSEGGRAICQTNDGGFAIAGYTFSKGEANADILLIKTDADGNKLWEKTLGGTGNEYANSIAQCSDGNFIIAGYTTSYGSGEDDVIVIKTDVDGNEIWSKYFGGAASDQANKVIVTSTDNYLIAGFTDSFGTGEDDFYLICLDQDGNEIWTSVDGDANSQFAKDIIETVDGDFLVVGSAGSFSPEGWGNRQVRLIKYDALGNIISTRDYGESTYQNWGNSICSSNNGSYIIVGDADITYQDLYQVYSIKTDGGQSTEWNQRTGRGTNYDYGITVSKLDDNNYIVLGNSKSNASGNNVYILHLNESGSVLKPEIIGDIRSDWGAQGIVTADGNYYIVTGHTNSSGAGLFDVLFLKIPVITITSVNKEEAVKKDFSLLQNYPNPFNPSTTINYTIPGIGKSRDLFVKLEILNLLGQPITTLVNEPQSPGTYNVKFDASNLPSGVYYYRLQADSFTQTNKMILVK